MSATSTPQVADSGAVPPALPWIVRWFAHWPSRYAIPLIVICVVLPVRLWIGAQSWESARHNVVQTAQAALRDAVFEVSRTRGLAAPIDGTALFGGSFAGGLMFDSVHPNAVGQARISRLPITTRLNGVITNLLFFCYMFRLKTYKQRKEDPLLQINFQRCTALPQCAHPQGAAGSYSAARAV